MLKRLGTALLALLVAVGVAACGDSGDGGGGDTGSGESEAIGGQFRLVPDAPSGYASLAGRATLERAGGGTTVALSLTGLEPRAEYVAHLHSGSCGQTDPGGPHFKFDPAGSEEPPNEIHLEFRAGADGAGAASASSRREVPPGEAGAIVLHEAGEGSGTAATAAAAGEAVLVHGGHDHDQGPQKIACAELEGDAAVGGGGGDAGPTVVVENGEPVGGVQELEFSAGDEVRFQVRSDVADEVHVHGYDLSEDVPAGGTVTFEFPAEIEGIFEIELEGRKEQIAELRVNP